MREACTFYQLSTSGGKKRCFERLWEFQKRLELQTALMQQRKLRCLNSVPHAHSTWLNLHLRRSNSCINWLMSPTRIGAQHVWHIEQGKIDNYVMMVSRLVRFPQYHLTLHTHVQLEQMAVSATQSRSLRWYWWTLRQTSLVAFPSKQNHSLTWWWWEKFCSSLKLLAIQNVFTCATTNPASDKFNNVQYVLDWHCAWPHVTKPLQLTAMEMHCAKTLCKGLEVWPGLWCTMSRKSFH